MDYTNCSAFWATDELFERTPIGTCDSSLIFLWTFYGIIIVLRFFAASKKWLNHFERKKANLKTSPIGPVLALSLAISYSIFFILMLTGSINVRNGLSFSAYTMCYLFFAGIYCLSLFRMVRLGTKIVSVSKELGNTSYLEKFDRNGMFLVIVASVSLLAMSVVLIFAGPIIPEDSILFGEIGWATKGVFQSFITFGLIWQLQRCHLLIKDKMPASERKDHVLQKLRTSQLHYSFFGLGLALFYYLLAARVVLWYWWAVVGITAMGEALAALAFEFRNFSVTSQKSNTTNMIGQIEAQNPNFVALKSSTDPNLSEEVTEHGDSDSGPLPPLIGLGIFTSKYKKNKFKANISRITEVSENRTAVSGQVEDT